MQDATLLFVGDANLVETSAAISLSRTKTTRIGRNPRKDGDPGDAEYAVISDPTQFTSQLHCAVSWNETTRSWVIEHLAKGNWTFVNGVRITGVCSLSHGDSVKIGHPDVSAFQYEFKEKCEIFKSEARALIRVLLQHAQEFSKRKDGERDWDLCSDSNAHLWRMQQSDLNLHRAVKKISSDRGWIEIRLKECKNSSPPSPPPVCDPLAEDDVIVIDGEENLKAETEEYHQKKRVWESEKRLLALCSSLDDICRGASDAGTELICGIGLVKCIATEQSKRSINHPLLEIPLRCVMSQDSETFILHTTDKVRVSEAVIEVFKFDGAKRLQMKKLINNAVESIGTRKKAFTPDELYPLLETLAKTCFEFPSPDVREAEEDIWKAELPKQPQIIRTWILQQQSRKAPVHAVAADAQCLSKMVERCEIPSFCFHLTHPFCDDAHQIAKPMCLADGSADSEEMLFPLPCNDDQQAILRKLKEKGAVVVRGPPGSGKTHSIANIACNYLAQGKRVLISSNGPDALLVMTEKIVEAVPALKGFIMSWLGKGYERRSIDQLKELHTSFQNLKQSPNVEVEAKNKLLEYREAWSEVGNKIKRIDEYFMAWSDMLLGKLCDKDLWKVLLDRIEPISPIERLQSQHQLLIKVLEGAQDDFKSKFPDLLGSDMQTFACEIKAMEEKMAIPVAADNLSSGHVSSEFVQWIQDPKFPPLDVPSLQSARSFFSQVFAGSGGPFNMEKYHRLCEALDKQKGSLPKISEDAQTQIRNLCLDLAIVKQFKIEVQKADVPMAKPEDQRVLALWRIRMDARASCEELLRMKKERREVIDEVISGGDPFKITKEGLSELSKALSEGVADGSKEPDLLRHARMHCKGRDDVVKNWLDKAEPVVSALSCVWDCDVDSSSLYQRAATLLRVFRALPPEAMQARQEQSGSDCHSNPALTRHPSRLLEGHQGDSEHSMSLEAWMKQNFVDNASKAIRTEEDATGLLLEYDWYDLVDAAMRSVATTVLSSETAAELEGSKRKAIELFGSFVWIINEFPKSLYNLRALLHKLSYFGLHALVSDLREKCLACKDRAPIPDYRVLKSGLRLLFCKGFLKSVIQAMPRFGGVSSRLTERNELETKKSKLAREIIDNEVKLFVSKNWNSECSADLDRAVESLAFLSKTKTKNGKTNTKDDKRARMRKSLDQVWSNGKLVEALPLWIMPSSEVSEILPAKIGCIDLVILDEASQSDFLAFPSLLRAKQVIIIGDECQVCPRDDKREERKTEQLEKLFQLHSHVSENIIPGRSIFDLFSKVIGLESMVVLREHYRCLPELIRFSNKYFYLNQMVPLRRAKWKLDGKYPIVVTKVDGKFNSYINAGEVEAIVKAVREILGDESVSHKDSAQGRTPRSIGIISLWGKDQANRIHTRMMEEISRADIKHHSMMWGDARAFQGWEKDIILISMVASDQNKARTGDDVGKEFNVALSRGKDFVYIFHSYTKKSEAREAWADSWPGRLLGTIEDAMEDSKIDSERVQSDPTLKLSSTLVGSCVMNISHKSAPMNPTKVVEVSGQGGAPAAMVMHGLDGNRSKDAWNREYKCCCMLSRMQWDVSWLWNFEELFMEKSCSDQLTKFLRTSRKMIEPEKSMDDGAEYQTPNPRSRQQQNKTTGDASHRANKERAKHTKDSKEGKTAEGKDARGAGGAGGGSGSKSATASGRKRAAETEAGYELEEQELVDCMLEAYTNLDAIKGIAKQCAEKMGTQIAFSHENKKKTREELVKELVRLRPSGVETTRDLAGWMVQNIGKVTKKALKEAAGALVKKGRTEMRRVVTAIGKLKGPGQESTARVSAGRISSEGGREPSADEVDNSGVHDRSMAEQGTGSSGDGGGGCEGQREGLNDGAEGGDDTEPDDPV